MRTLVWIVLEPTYCGYNDYSIVGVYATKEAAEKNAEYNFKIEEWEIKWEQ